MLVEAVAADQRVVRGDAVGPVAVAGIDVDPEEAPEEVLGHVLAVAAADPVVPVLDVAGALVARGAAIADRDVEVAVGAEGQVPGVVVPLRLGDLEDGPLGVPSDGPAVRRGPELRQDERVAVAVGRPRPRRRRVPEVEPAVVGERGVERDAEQALLAARGDGVPEVERGVVSDAVGAVGDHQPGLLEDVPPVGVGEERHPDGGAQPLDDGLEADPLGAAVGRRARRLGRARAARAAGEAGERAGARRPEDRAPGGTVHGAASAAEGQ